MAKKSESKSKGVKLEAVKNIRGRLVGGSRVYAGQTFETDEKTANMLKKRKLAK